MHLLAAREKPGALSGSLVFSAVRVSTCDQEGSVSAHTLPKLLNRTAAKTEREKGTYFERLAKACLKTTPAWPKSTPAC